MDTNLVSARILALLKEAAIAGYVSQHIDEIDEGLSERAWFIDGATRCLEIAVHARNAAQLPVTVAAGVGWVSLLTHLFGEQRLCKKVGRYSRPTPLFAKPRGVMAAAIYVALTPPGAQAPADPNDYRFVTNASRFPAMIEFKGAEAGQTAHYLARWLNTRCEAGPWSATASATVAG